MNKEVAKQAEELLKSNKVKRIFMVVHGEEVFGFLNQDRANEYARKHELDDPEQYPVPVVKEESSSDEDSQANIGDLNKELEESKKLVADSKKEVAGLKGQVTKLTNKLEASEKLVEKSKMEIESLNNEIADLKEKLKAQEETEEEE
jgi:chromosome segregation ATPase